jgi:NAD(P)-dependent dehydrogenase (short-subunit alcohol dehydrogenase family)
MVTRTRKPARSTASLEGITALVTGGSSGNGRAIALALAEHGAATVIIADAVEAPREDPNAASTAALLASTPTEGLFVECDLANDDDIQRLAGVAISHDVGLLINNAGVYWRRELADETLAGFDLMMRVNVRAPFFLSKLLAESLSAQRGSIVNISSGSALIGSPGFASYTTTKAATHGLTIALAAELGPADVRVNEVLPGRIRTAMTTLDVPTIDRLSGESDVSQIPLGHYGEPQDVAEACVYLASPAARFVTAASLVVDGGYVRAGRHSLSRSDRP